MNKTNKGAIRGIAGGDVSISRLRRGVTAAIALITVAAAPLAQAQDVFETALRKCAVIEADDARLTCYDALATVMPPAASAAPEPAAAPPAPAASVGEAAAVAATTAAVSPAPQPLTDEVGKERVKGAERDAVPAYAANVTRCEESVSSGQMYFFFENGQVWKQSNYRRLGFRNCQFDVTLSKDTFGYEIYIPSKDRSVRVSRVR